MNKRSSDHVLKLNSINNQVRENQYKKSQTSVIQDLQLLSIDKQ